MAQPDKHETVRQMLDRRVSAIIRTSDQALAARAMRAAVEGGIRMVEFTLTTPGATELIRDFSKEPELTVGAGTVLTREQARAAAEAGARFLVSPITDPQIIKEAGRLNAACIPGTFTPTEMETAHRAGADFVKVFPEPHGGIGFIHAVRGPLPHLRLFPTAGPTPDNFLEYLDAGCAGVGFVRALFDPNDLVRGDFDAVRKRAALISRRLADWLARRPATSETGVSR